MMGVTLPVYRVAKGDPTLTCGDLRNITSQDVETIYQAYYWNPVSAGQLPSGVDLSVCDQAFNSGVHSSVVLLQRAVGVAEDGVIGPATMAAIQAIDPSNLIDSLYSVQLAFYESLSGWQTFGRGWTNRVTARQQAAHNLIAV